MAETRVRAGEVVFEDEEAGFFSQFLKGGVGAATDTLETVNKAGLQNRAKKAGENAIDQYSKYRDAGYSKEEATARVNKQRGGFLNKILAGGKQEDFTAPVDDKAQKAQRKTTLEAQKTKAGIAKTEAETKAKLAEAQGGGFSSTQRRKQKINKDNALRAAKFGKIFDTTTETYSKIPDPDGLESYLSNKFKDTDINDPDIQYEIGKQFGEFREDDPTFSREVQIRIFQLLNDGHGATDIVRSLEEDIPGVNIDAYWFKEKK